MRARGELTARVGTSTKARDPGGLAFLARHGSSTSRALVCQSLRVAQSASETDLFAFLSPELGISLKVMLS